MVKISSILIHEIKSYSRINIENVTGGTQIFKILCHMLNKIRTEPELSASIVDPSTVKEDTNFSWNFDFGGLYRGSECQQGVHGVDFS